MMLLLAIDAFMELRAEKKLWEGRCRCAPDAVGVADDWFLPCLLSAYFH